jgi:L-arabinose isomerase
VHIRFTREIPWPDIDMYLMKLSPSDHGYREFGFIGGCLRLERQVIVCNWQGCTVRTSLGAACADWQGTRVVRLDDNMREVVFMEGAKLEAKRRLGYAINGYGVGSSSTP